MYELWCRGTSLWDAVSMPRPNLSHLYSYMRYPFVMSVYKLFNKKWLDRNLCAHILFIGA